MAFDRSRNALVMFGSVLGATDTWAWQGTGWQQLATTSNPPAMGGPQLHDDGTGITLFHASSREIWQLRGNAWTMADRLPQAPVYRNNTAFAYDHARNVLVGFGGDQGGLNVPPDQTMLYDRGWLPCAPATNPPLRHSAGLAWSDLNQQVLLFGGVYQGTIHRGDTWLWDGTDWQAQQPTQSPSPREGAVLAQDPLGGVMLFGGKDAIGRRSSCPDPRRANGRNTPTTRCAASSSPTVASAATKPTCPKLGLGTAARGRNTPPP